MIKPILLFALYFTSISIFAQKHKCYTDQASIKYQETNKQYVSIRKQNEKAVKHWIEANRHNLIPKTFGTNGGGALATIPVVFHVVYKNAAQNIADSNIFRQIEILNECYRKTNANYNQTRPIFDSVGADVQIEFCLAQLDPNGNPTSGITRTSAPSNAGFDPLLNMDKVKSSATNGVDPWPTDQYLNIWVCDMSILSFTIVLGYATFPGSDPLLDGVVIQYNFIGLQANGTSSDLGKTTVHEVGHWLGMRHIWGDGQQAAPLCDSTDYVDDTPNADTASQQTCLIKNSCSNESSYWTSVGVDPPDMIENYMDYSYDACMTLFTNGQKARMLGFLNTTRASLLTSPGGCNPIGIKGNTVSTHSIEMFPNPAKNTLTFKLKTNTDMTVSITDALGKNIGLYIINRENPSIDISNLSAGILFYTLSENGQKTQSGKLVKMD